MKVHCHDCQYSIPTGCSKNQKNGYNNCKKFKAISMGVLKKERNRLLLSGTDPTRLEYLTEKLLDFNGGTI
jgi:hypothetical protein